MPESYEILGLMSGSSLDGLDLAWCRFERSHPAVAFQYELQETSCRPFPEKLLEKLRRCRDMSALELAEAERDFLVFSAGCISDICQKTKKKPLAVASHGHTVFHNPGVGYSWQMGNGGVLAGLCGFPVISDFRTLDIGLGGQGAPLVPGAEAGLFPDYNAFLNLGGICNISFCGEITAGFDVAPCNQLLNFASQFAGKDYDDNGEMAASGMLLPELMEQLISQPYYKKDAPKSLSNEEVVRAWIPLLESFSENPPSILHTLCLHIAGCIASALPPHGGKMLITGGGAFNRFLTDSIRKSCGEKWQITIGDEKLVNSKEALCFAWLGLKRLLNETNVLSSVTGAPADSVSGALYGINPILYRNQRISDRDE
jgi:anhydro-N-acetylmuramic acid kinase